MTEFFTFARITIAVVLFSLGALSGYNTAKSEAEKAAAIAAADQGRKDYEKLIVAFELTDSVRVDLDRARDDARRMRRALVAAEKNAAAGSLDGAGVTKCAKLLDESIKLLSECREKYLGCAGRHDALVEAVK